MIPLYYYLIISLIINIIIFLIAYKLKTDKLTDISYALTFILLATIAFLFSDKSTLKIILFLIITLWATRLGIFLLIRINKTKKDKRFDKIRNNFSSFLKFWTLQGLTVFIILIPSLLLFNTKTKITPITITGIIIFLIGFFTETIADIQKYNFNKKHKNKFITTGLWKYSRHPNYFGEILVWIGIYFLAFSSISTPQKIYAIISPAFIIILLTLVSGIPILEKNADKRWGKQEQYQNYKKKTSILIPWIKK